MERRNRSLEALNSLIYINSLDGYEKADALVLWHDKYLLDKQISDFDLEHNDLKNLLELFYTTTNFLKNHKEQTRKDMIENKKLKRFLNN